MSHTRTIGDRSGDLAGQGNMSTLWSMLHYKSGAFPWPPSDQHIAITGTKEEPAFFRKHKRFQLCPLMSSGLTLMVSQMAMAWSQWNTRYRASCSELFLK
ncbi:uncharacterized protein TNCV_5008311 [Trichonephila clavipes]|nr:uncharacterized protein TNCV_5008311 [Trichonephila clavipes]